MLPLTPGPSPRKAGARGDGADDADGPPPICVIEDEATWRPQHVLRQRRDPVRGNLIYSPAVPVIRDDEDQLLAVPYSVSIITAPAVNAGAVRANEPQHVSQIEAVMLGRIEKLLEAIQGGGVLGFRRLASLELLPDGSQLRRLIGR